MPILSFSFLQFFIYGTAKSLKRWFVKIVLASCICFFGISYALGDYGTCTLLGLEKE